MTWHESERLYTLNEAATFARGRRRPHLSTIWRWATKGIGRRGRKVFLETIRTNSGWLTSKEAVHRFEAAAAKAMQADAPLASKTTPAAAVEYLQQEGIA